MNTLALPSAPVLLTKETMVIAQFFFEDNPTPLTKASKISDDLLKHEVEFKRSLVVAFPGIRKAKFVALCGSLPMWMREPVYFTEADRTSLTKVPELNPAPVEAPVTEKAPEPAAQEPKKVQKDEPKKVLPPRIVRTVKRKVAAKKPTKKSAKKPAKKVNKSVKKSAKKPAKKSVKRVAKKGRK